MEDVKKKLLLAKRDSRSASRSLSRHPSPAADQDQEEQDERASPRNPYGRPPRLPAESQILVLPKTSGMQVHDSETKMFPEIYAPEEQRDISFLH